MNRRKSHSGALTGVIVVVILIAVIAFAFLNIDKITSGYLRSDADVYYTRVAGTGERHEEQYTTGSGKKATDVRYEYTLASYNDNGDEKDMNFTAAKELKDGAFLKIYYKEAKGVTSYEEVAESKLPAKAAAVYK